MAYTRGTRALTLFGVTAQRILEARPEFEGIDPRGVWGEEKKRNWNAVDRDKLFLVTLMKHFGWKPPRFTHPPTSEGGWLGYINGVNSEELALFEAWVVEQKYWVATITDAIPYAAATAQHAPAEWGSW